eukprot:gene3797-2687_t
MAMPQLLDGYFSFFNTYLLPYIFPPNYLFPVKLSLSMLLLEGVIICSGYLIKVININIIIIVNCFYYLVNLNIMIIVNMMSDYKYYAYYKKKIIIINKNKNNNNNNNRNSNNNLYRISERFFLIGFVLREEYWLCFSLRIYPQSTLAVFSCVFCKTSRFTRSFLSTELFLPFQSIRDKQSILFPFAHQSFEIVSKNKNCFTKESSIGKAVIEIVVELSFHSFSTTNELLIFLTTPNSHKYNFSNVFIFEIEYGLKRKKQKQHKMGNPVRKVKKRRNTIPSLPPHHFTGYLEEAPNPGVNRATNRRISPVSKRAKHREQPPNPTLIAPAPYNLFQTVALHPEPSLFTSTNRIVRCGGGTAFLVPPTMAVKPRHVNCLWEDFLFYIRH